MSDNLTIRLNLENLAVTQYGAFDFTSFCVFDGVPLGANEEGIFVLEQGDDDDGLAIKAIVETHKTDFGASFQKRMRSAYLGGEFGGDLTLLVKTDDSERTFTIAAEDARMLQQSRKTGIGRDQKGPVLAVQARKHKRLQLCFGSHGSDAGGSRQKDPDER